MKWTEFHTEYEMTRQEYDRFSRPCVYVLYKGEKCLYVGASKQGYRRVFARDGMLGRDQAFMEFDRIKIVFYQKEKDAFDAEKKLIETCSPVYNVTFNHQESSTISSTDSAR